MEGLNITEFLLVTNLNQVVFNALTKQAFFLKD